MKNLLIFFVIFNTYISSSVDWSDPNQCKLPDHSEFTSQIVNEMTLEQKVGQIIMPEINSVTPEEAKKSILNTKNDLTNLVLIFDALKTEFRKSKISINPKCINKC